MIGVKLTILGITILAIFICVVDMAVTYLGEQHRFFVQQNGDGPTWLGICGMIIWILGLLDMAGVLWTAIYLLFLR